jgi:hypothetical protein
MYRVGTWVGAKRWPNRMSHPDNWGKPIGGQVIDFTDPRAWANTPQFPADNPHAGDVMGVALKAKSEGHLDNVIPVYWDFGSHRRVCWERINEVHTFEEDIALWKAAKAMKWDELIHPRRRKARTIAEFLPETMQHLAPA